MQRPFSVVVADLALLLTDIHAVSHGKPLYKTNVVVPSNKIKSNISHV